MPVTYQTMGMKENFTPLAENEQINANIRAVCNDKL
jgi:hypothetical protein